MCKKKQIKRYTIHTKVIFSEEKNVENSNFKYIFSTSKRPNLPEKYPSNLDHKQVRKIENIM